MLLPCEGRKLKVKIGCSSPGYPFPPPSLPSPPSPPPPPSTLALAPPGSLPPFAPAPKLPMCGPVVGFGVRFPEEEEETDEAELEGEIAETEEDEERAGKAEEGFPAKKTKGCEEG